MPDYILTVRANFQTSLLRKQEKYGMIQCADNDCSVHFFIYGGFLNMSRKVILMIFFIICLISKSGMTAWTAEVNSDFSGGDGSGNI